MSRKIVRVGDYHVCPLWDGKTPHVGGPVITGVPNVLINGKPVAVVGSRAMCNCGEDVIVSGDPRLLINGLPVAVLGAPTAHGGQVVECSGDMGVGGSPDLPNAEALREEWQEALEALPDDHPAAEAIRQCLSYLGARPVRWPDYPTVPLREADSILPDLYYPTCDAERIVTPFSPQDLTNVAEAATVPAVSSVMNQADTTDATEAAPGPADQSDKKAEPLKVIISAGFFFDGTANNRANSDTGAQWRREKRRGRMTVDDYCKRVREHGPSYDNDWTNVAKLQRLYFDRVRDEGDVRLVGMALYIEGIGTLNGEEDSTWCMGTGRGKSGILAKVERAAEEYVRQYSTLKEQRILTSTDDYELVVDVFGFSRGAAAARHFINDVLAGEGGHFYTALRAAGVPLPASVTIRFAGLFDTVASVFSVISEDGVDLSTHNDKHKPVILRIPPEKVGFAVQLCAGDEFRLNFALTSLRNPDGSLPENFREWVFPGAHSDIGGGYVTHAPGQPDEREQVYLDPGLKVEDSFMPFVGARGPEESLAWKELDKKRQPFLAHPWCSGTSFRDTVQIREDEREGRTITDVVEIVADYQPGNGNAYSRQVKVRTRGGQSRQIRQTFSEVCLNLIMRRKLYGEYSRIFLYLMHEVAVGRGVPFLALEEPSYSVPQDNPDQKEYSTDRLNGTRIPGCLYPVWQEYRALIRDGKPIELSPTLRTLLYKHYIHYSASYQPDYVIAIPNEPADEREIFFNV